MTGRHRHGPLGWRWVLRQVPSRLSLLATTGFVAVALLVVLGLMHQQQASTAELDAAQSRETLTRVADPLAALCSEDAAVRARLGDEVCFTAQEVVQRPEPAPRDGVNGRGIVATVIRDDGHLLVTYTDGAKIDVGPVAGETGEPGRGIVSSTITDGRLVLAYSDGTTHDVGRIVGERGAQGDPGRGVESIEIVDGRLVVTYSDGASEDAGPVPPGPPGPQGPQGETGPPAERMTITHADGSTEVCTRSGGPDDAPEYDCAPPPAGS